MNRFSGRYSPCTLSPFRWLISALIVSGTLVGSAPEVRILELQPVGPNNHWQVRWSSTPGLDYQLQRTAGDVLPTTNPIPWLPLVTLRATGEVSTASDPAGPLVRQRFYRVVEWTNTLEDTQPPTITYAGVEAASMPGGADALRVRFLANDNVGVSSLTVREGVTSLGDAVPAGGDLWTLLVPGAFGSFEPRLFTGIASDPSGNTAQTTGGVLASDPDYFAQLDANGQPREGRLLFAVTTNQAGPFLFRPGGRPRPGAAPDFFLKFPDGATFRQVNGQTVIEFVRVIAGFDTNSPFRFPAPLERNGGAARQLVIGALPFSQLAGLFDRNPADGLSLTLFDRFPLRWRGGLIDDRGLPGAEFLPDLGDLPLPGWSRALPGMLVDFARERTLRIPFSGEFPLPDGTANSPRVRVGSGSPLWLTLRADGQMSLKGPMEIGWPNGQNVRAELTLDDPNYCLALEASGLRIQAASNLVDLLPSNPTACVPAAATPAQLDQGTRCLDSFARAYAHFSALVAASASNAPPSAAEPPSGLNAAGAALEAWGYSAAAGVAQALPLDAIADLVAQLGHQAGSAPELPEVLANRLALMRARRLAQLNALTGSASSQAALAAALAEAEAAALDRARNPDAALSLAGMKQAARLLVETEGERQSAGLPPGPLLGELPGLFQRFADRQADRFGVKTNVFVPDANPAINTLNRFVAIETLRDLIDVQANAQFLDVNLVGTRLDELTGQLGVRLLRTVNVALDTAEAAADLPAFVLAAQDFIELGAWVQLGLFPSVPELTLLGSGSAFVTLGSRLNTLAIIELDRPFGEKTLGRQTHEIRALLRVLRDMPGTVTFASPPFERAYDKLEEQLNLAVSPAALAQATNLLSMLELIEAGTLHRELGARFGFPQPVNWETNRLPQVAQRFAELATTQRGWRELDQAVRLLLNAADRAGLVNDQNRRRAYLQQTAVLLGASRTVARALLLDASGLLRVIDFALPGDIFIDRPAGMLCYQRVTREVSAQVRGALRLPKFGIGLEVLDASIHSGGAFRIDAFGQLVFPQPDPIGSAMIPRNRPLRLSYSPEDGLRLASDAELTFDNGMFFRGSILLDDPIYEFALEAGGFQFRLAKALGCEQPAQLPSAGAPVNTLSNLNTFHGAMAESLTKAAGAAAAESEAAPATTETDSGSPPPDVTAWKHFVLLHADDLNPPDIRPMIEPLLTLLETETDGLADAGQSLASAPAAATGFLPPADNGPLPTALQVDAGTIFSFVEEGPAHQDGIVPPGQTTWNVVNGDRAAGLLFADGTAVDGISLDFGRSPSATAPIDWNLGVGQAQKTDLFAPPLGIFQNELMADAVTTFGQPSDGPRGKLALRVRGLPPAYYQVYTMASPFVAGGSFGVQIGGETAGGSFNLQSFVSGIPADLELAPLWMAGITHVTGGVTISEPGDSIVIIVSPTEDVVFPLLNGVQIAAALPVIKSFTATANSIQQGETPQLKWNTAFADQISIDPGGVGLAPSGALTVRPAQTTTYTLTARNANGVATATVTIQVQGAGRNLAGVVRKLNRVTAMTREAADAIKAMTRAQLRDQVDNAAFARLRTVFERQNQILVEVIDDPSASSNPETARQVVRSMIDVSANSSLSGFEGIVDHGKIQTFFERALDEFEGSLGFDPQTGSIDLTVVRSKSADESFDAVTELLDVAADAAALGSGRTYNEELIQAYFVGAREDLLDLMQFDRATGQAALETIGTGQLREAADGLTRVEEAKGIFGDEISAPPAALQQLADALQQRAVATLTGGRILRFGERLVAVRDLRSGNALLAQLQQESRHGDLIVAQLALLLEESARTAGSARRLTADETEVMTLASDILGDAAVEAAYQQRLAKAIRGFNLIVATPLLPERINQGPLLVRELGTLHELVRALLASGRQPGFSSDLFPEQLAPQLTARFTALAHEKKAGKQLKEFNAAMLDLAKKLSPAAGAQGLRAAGAPDPLATVLLSQVAVSLGVSADITTTLCSRLGPAPEDLSVADVVVERVFGSILYNRETGFLSGRFGGSVSFPGLETRFAIREASLASDGSFGVDAALAAPAPFGRARLQTSLAITGTPAGVATFGGAGTLTVPNGDQGDRVFDVMLSYSQADQRLSFDAQGNNLDLRLSEDFVLFGAGFGFDLRPGLPEGSFRANGSAGMFAVAKPLPPVVGSTNFHLSVESLTTVFSYTTNAFAISLSNGTIRLPEFFHNGLCPTNPGQPATGPQLALVPTNPVTVTVGTGANPATTFTGALDFRNLGFIVPGLTNLAVEVCSARLLFRSNALPCLTDLNATLTVPLPQQTAIVDVTGVEWCVDGFPTAASVSLRENLRLLDLSGFALDFETNSAFGFTSTLDGLGQRSTVFNLEGGLRGTFDGDLLFDEQNQAAFSFGTSGAFRWETGRFPDIALNEVTFGGRIKLGGENGFELLGVDANGIPDTNTVSQASITLTGLTNLLELTPDRTFEVSLNGALGSAEFLYFGLRDARFIFDGIGTFDNPEPQFQVSSLGFREGNQLKLLGQELLPFRITSGSITFLSPGQPLDRLFAPTNLLFTFSGVVDISLAAPDSNEPGNIPRLFGAVDNVQVSLPNGFSGLPQFSVNTFVLLLENLTIGDMAGLSGGLAVGNLNNPAELFFAGTVGGGFNGVAIKAIVATRLDGLLGLCLNVNAGPAGIPLDGGSLGGILLTGAEGGVSFLNEFADPCDFKSYLGLTGEGTPGGGGAAGRLRAASTGPRVSHLRVLSWAELQRLQTLHEQRKSLQAAGVTPAQLSAFQPTAASHLRAAGAGPNAGADVPCPTGNCPPATINLYCQRHPSVAEEPSAENYQGAYRTNVIFKFTSLDREIVDEILDTAGINLNGSASVVATNFANATRDLINGLIPRPPDSLGTNQAQINAFIDASLDAMRDLVASSVQLALQAAAGQGRTPIEALYEAAYAGVPCVDITIQLKGTFSYSPISVALSATGGAVASTTGSAGILGSVNLFGLPVGTGEFFFSQTDTNGNPNPSLCGGARVAVGPLDLAQLGLAIGCDECVTGTLNAMAQFVSGLTGDIATQAGPILYAFIEHAAGQRITGISGRPLTAYFGPEGSGALLTQEEQIAVITALLNLPEVVKFLEANPQAISEFNRDALTALGERTLQLVLAIYNSVNPRLQFCGEVEPKIFGFSLTGGNTLVAARLYADKTSLRGDATFSPSYVFGNLPFIILSSGSIANVVPALDEATMGFALGLPLVNETTLRLLGTNPVEFASTQVNHLLANATMTFGYELSPFGFKLADGEGRIALPTIEHHPNNPLRAGGSYVRPAFPDRTILLKAALDANVLAQATWAGRGGDLTALFPPGSAEANAVSGRELIRDYFPYGGFLGAAKLQFPKPLVDAPPFAQLAELFSPLSITNALDRIALAQEIFTNYIIGSSNLGNLMVHVPFPRPPAIFWTVPQGPQAFIDAIAGTDVASLVQGGLDLYPVSEFFMRGDVQAQILGLPLVEGEMVADPAQGLFRMSLGVANDSWLTNFVQGGVTGLVRSAEYILQTNPEQLPPGTTAADLQPEARLQAALQALQTAAQSGSTEAERNLAISIAIARITDTLPKVSLEAALQLRLPGDLTSFLQFNSGAGLFAFSPRFESGYALPGYAGLISFPDPDPNNPGPYTLARRNGGVAAVGHFVFGFNLTDPDVNRRLVINVPEAALGIAGTANPSLFPALNGRFRVDEISLPNVFAFNGSTSPGFQFRDGLLQFNSQPTVGADYLHVAGAMSPIDLGPFLRVRPLPTNANPANLLAGSLRVTKTASGANMALSLNPAEATIPMFGPSLTGLIYGSLSNGVFTPFTFSTVPGQPWAATVRLEGAVAIRSPLDPNGPVLFRAEPLMSGGRPVPFEVAVSGTGLETFELRLTVPNGVQFTLFPGTAHESVFRTGSESATCLFVASDGRVYFDSGTRTLDLNGLASVRGRIEFGFEPVDRTPMLGRTTPTNFVARLGRSHEQIVTIRNTNVAGSQLTVDAVVTDQTHFSVLPNRLLLGPGQQGQLRLRFTPRSAGTFARQLILTNNSALARIVVPITGVVATLPRMHVNVSAINFGATPLGTTRSQAVRVSNLGDTTLILSNVVTTAAPFTDNRSGNVNIAVGSFADIIVSFTPPSTTTTNGLLTFASNDPLAPTGQVTLNGSGSNRFWYRQRRGGGYDHLKDIEVKSDRDGFALGLNGAFLRTLDANRAWLEDFRPDAPDLNAVAFVGNNDGWMAGAKGLAYLTSNQGVTWTLQTHALLANTNIDWRAMSFIDPVSESVVLGGQTNNRVAVGPARIVFGKASIGFNESVVPSAARGINGIAFATNKVGIAVGDRATILRTTDEAKTWSLIAPPGGLPTNTTLRAVAPNPANAANFIIVGDDGFILRTTDGGSTWTLPTSQTTEDLHAVVRVGNVFYAAGDNGVIRRSSATTGVSWFVEDALTTTDFRGLASHAGEVWAASADGDIFHRRTNAIGGPLSVVNASDLTFGNIAIGERVFGEITVANEGTTNLTAEVKSDSADFIVRPDRSVVIPPGCQTLFTVSFDRAGGGGFGTTIHVETSDDSDGKIDLPISLVNRHPGFTPLAYAQLPPCIDLGTVLVDGLIRYEIPITNLGQADLNLHDIIVRSEDTRGIYEFQPFFSGPLPARDGGFIHLDYVPRQTGVQRGQIEVTSDARNGVALIEFTANVVPVPEVVVIDSIPRGATVQVNGANTTTPAAFSIVDTTPGAGQLRRGSNVTVRASASHLADGVPYSFQRWDPGTGTNLTFIAGTNATKFTARYAPSLNAGPAVPEPPTNIASRCSFNPPVDVAFGPWVKITQAKMTLPWLREGTNGAAFKVEGALFLSLQKAYGSLSSSRIRVTVPEEAAFFDGTEVLEITPGAWNFDVEAGFFRVSALSPGVQILNASALPPTSLLVEVDARTNSANRRALTRFATLDELPLAPGLLAIGPSGVTNEISLNPLQPRFLLAMGGSLRALARPTGSGWVVNRPCNFVFDPALPSIGPVTFSTRTQLADLALLRVYANAGGQIGPSFDGTTFSLIASNLALEFFRSDEFINTSSSIQADGTFSFAATIPSGGVSAGLARFNRLSSGDQTLSIVANPLQSKLAVHFPPTRLGSSSSPQIWSDLVDLPAFDFDSENFAVRVPLPGIDFAKIELEKTEDTDEDNYFEFKRVSGETRVKVRNRQDLFLGALQLGLSVSSSGNVSGHLSGRLGVEGPSPLDAVSDRISIDFRDSPAPEFILNRYFLGVPSRLKMGSNLPFGGKACLLDPLSDKPLVDREETLCLP